MAVYIVHADTLQWEMESKYLFKVYLCSLSLEAVLGLTVLLASGNTPLTPHPHKFNVESSNKSHYLFFKIYLLAIFPNLLSQVYSCHLAPGSVLPGLADSILPCLEFVLHPGLGVIL